MPPKSPARYILYACPAWEVVSTLSGAADVLRTVTDSPMGMVTAGDTKTVLFNARWRQIRYTESTNHLSKYKSFPTHSKSAPSTPDRRTVPTEQRNCLPTTSYSPQMRSSS